MELESAVGSVIAAESVPGAALEALKAQAVVTRSFYAGARGRHSEFDFCDTTHCQFLKQTPSPGSLAARVTDETRGLLLIYQGRVLAALYSAACGGRTRALLTDRNASYPYFSVDCDYCMRHPGILNRYYPATATALWPAETSQTPSKFTKKQSTFIPGNLSFRTAAALASSPE